jgi:hypothetical protein
MYNPDSGYTGSGDIYNNTVYGGGPSLFLGYSSGSRVRNNILSPTPNVAEYAVRIDGSLPAAGDIDYNLIYAPNASISTVAASYSQWRSIGFDAHGLNVDPKLVTPGSDFSLQSSSPAIDRGVTISGLTRDYNGTARPQGGAFDIGAYEYVGTIWSE